MICFDIFFALAHKPFWSLLHPNTFKNHPQLKLQEIQQKTNVNSDQRINGRGTEYDSFPTLKQNHQQTEVKKRILDSV